MRSQHGPKVAQEWKMVDPRLESCLASVSVHLVQMFVCLETREGEDWPGRLKRKLERKKKTAEKQERSQKGYNPQPQPTPNPLRKKKEYKSGKC